MYAQLGNITFSTIKGFTGVSSGYESNLVEHALIDGKPKLQHIGNNLKTLELTMMFDSTFCNPQSEIDALYSSLELAEVLPLILGNGAVQGQFVIKGVTKSHLDEGSDGSLLQAEVTVSLVEYATDDPQASAQANAISNGFANQVNSPAEFLPEIVPIEPSAIACQNMVDVTAQLSQSTTDMAQLVPTAPRLLPVVDGIIRSMLMVADQINNTLVIINADELSEIYVRTRPLASNLLDLLALSNDILSEAQNCRAQIDAGNELGVATSVNSLATKSVELKNKVAQTSSSSASLISLAVTQ